MEFIEQIERDKAFGLEIMQAAGIRTPGVLPLDGLQINVMTWFSMGARVGPVIAYMGNETSIQLMWPYQIREPRIFQATIKKALPIIKKTTHSGHVSLRCLINSHDQKVYGIRWQSSLTKEIICAMSSILKVSFAEWTKWLTDGCDGEWLMNQFYYAYAGSVIDAINTTNNQLLMFRSMGYELPFNLENPLVQA